MTGKKVLILINTGTPDSPGVRSVRRYLSEFLNDSRVIDIPWLLRKLLVNLIIVPFRAPVSARKYRKLWTETGSPLLLNLENLVSRVQILLKDEYEVISAMRYGNPSLQNALEYAGRISPEQITIFPLYPHYASSTTGSVNEYVLGKIRKWDIIPVVKLTGQFYSHPAYTEAMISHLRAYDPVSYDHVLFSYHGLPLSHIERIHPGTDCSKCSCDKLFPAECNMCYKATCYATTRSLADKLNLSPGKFSTSFQSRLTRSWLEPFTDTVLIDLAGNGKKKVLVVAPSFVADCLETIIEIDEEYRTLFMKEGGEEFIVAKSLNDNDLWAKAIIQICDL
jgi:ferrochelatase